MLHVRHIDFPGQNLAVTVERLTDGFVLDVAASPPAFVAPGQAKQPLTALAPGPYPNRYDANLAAPDGAHLVNVVEVAAPTQVKHVYAVEVRNGDDATPAWDKLLWSTLAKGLASAAQQVA